MTYSHLLDLECSRTGDRYDADQVQGVSKVGAPLLARYDLDRVARASRPSRSRAGHPTSGATTRCSRSATHST